MYIHLLGLIVTLFFARNARVYSYSGGSKNAVRYRMDLIFLSIVPFTFISGVRYFVGTDWKMYRNVFLQVRSGKQFSSLYFEKGYILLNKIIGLFSDNYTVYFTVIAFLVTALWFFTIYYLSENPVESIILWVISQFYFFSFNGMRQALAISLSYFGLIFLQKKKYLIYLVIVLLAITIHRSAIIMIPLLMFGNIKMKISRYIVVMIGSILVGRFSIQIVNQYSIFEKYRMYLNVKSDFSFSDFVILIVVWFFAVAIKKQAEANHNEKFNMFYNILFYSIVLCVFTAFIPYMYRFLLFFKYITVLLIPEIFKEYKNIKSSIFMRATIYSLYCVQFLYYGFVMHYNEYINYAWVLGKNL